MTGHLPIENMNLHQLFPYVPAKTYGNIPSSFFNNRHDFSAVIKEDSPDMLNIAIPTRHCVIEPTVNDGLAAKRPAAAQQ